MMYQDRSGTEVPQGSIFFPSTGSGQRKIVIDIAGLLVDRKTFNNDDFLIRQPRLGALPFVRKLVHRFERENVAIASTEPDLSKRERRREWLDHHRFLRPGMLASENLFFCNERREKRDICQAFNGTDFADDRGEVMTYLLELPNVQLYLHDPRPEEVARYQSLAHHPRIQRTYNLAELQQAIFGSISIQVAA